jgi:hypothetical protein
MTFDADHTLELLVEEHEQRTEEAARAARAPRRRPPRALPGLPGGAQRALLRVREGPRMSRLVAHVRALMFGAPKPKPGCCLARIEMYTTPARAKREPTERKAS